MGVTVDFGLWKRIAEAVLEDNPEDEASKKILERPYRVNDKHFATKEELQVFLNSKEFEKEVLK